ncbi:6,7-dimethyl-8-ribityllumazine synthase [Sneathiella glossodoripedis]|uniref:6,7-dimethyl-8-ribityllumazine synthase n=1 Tax=Sneathiella glossodoripedis TaxID=418853 RepID=UPI0004709C69|nr:6,7-dimethyl-8-ribityllumazine synthase [Sneathiella glossodoripedis]
MNEKNNSDSLHSAVKNSTRKIAVIQANWHIDIVSNATGSFIQDLVKAGLTEQRIDVIDVPGSLEIPLMAQKLAKSNSHDLIMATGLIVDGGIYRHDFVSRTVLDGMMRVQLDTEVPVLSVVLTPHNFQEVPAHMEFFANHFVQKGQEAAKAAIQTLNTFATLQQPDRLAS